MSKPFVHFNTEHTIVLRKFLTKKKEILQRDSMLQRNQEPSP